MSAKDVQGDLLLLGRGKVYFDRFTTAGAKTGERFVGNCTRLEVTTTDELREKYSSATNDSPLMKSVNVRRTIEFALTLDEFDIENVALALMGDDGDFLQAAGGPITDESVTVVKTGRYYQLGGPAAPAGDKRAVTSVVVTDDPMTTTYTLGTDYDEDLVRGRIYIIPGGGISDGDGLLVDYSYSAKVAGDIPQINAGAGTTIEGYLRFVGDPAAGPVYEAQIWKISISPDGAVGLISDDFGEFPLKGKVLDDSVNHPSEPLYRLLKLS